jgi:hypothetical protein
MNLFFWVKPVETDVVALAIKVKNGIVVLEADIAKASQWLVAEAPTLEAGATELVGIATAVGATANPNVALAAAAVTAASGALNAYAAKANSGANAAELVVTAYTATKTATAAIATAKASLLAPTKGN